MLKWKAPEVFVLNEKGNNVGVEDNVCEKWESSHFAQV